MQITNFNELQGTTTPISICMFRISLHFLDWILVGEIQVPPKFPSQLWQPQPCHGSWKVQSLKFGSQVCDVFRRIQPKFLPRHSPLRQISSQMSTSMPQLSTVKAKHQDHPTLRLLPRNCKRCIIIWTTSPSNICIIQLSWRNFIESTSRMSSVLFDQWNEDVWGVEDQPGMAPKTHNLAKTHRPWRPCPWNWNMNQKYPKKGWASCISWNNNFEDETSKTDVLHASSISNSPVSTWPRFQTSLADVMATMARSKVLRQRVISSMTHEKPPEIHLLKNGEKNILCWPLWTPTLRTTQLRTKTMLFWQRKIVRLHGFHDNFSRSHGFTTVHVGGTTSMLNSWFTHIPLKPAVHTEPQPEKPRTTLVLWKFLMFNW